jgi:hypothetical protein
MRNCSGLPGMRGSVQKTIYGTSAGCAWSPEGCVGRCWVAGHCVIPIAMYTGELEKEAVREWIWRMNLFEKFPGHQIVFSCLNKGWRSYLQSLTRAL